MVTVPKPDRQLFVRKEEEDKKEKKKKETEKEKKKKPTSAESRKVRKVEKSKNANSSPLFVSFTPHGPFKGSRWKHTETKELKWI